MVAKVGFKCQAFSNHCTDLTVTIASHAWYHTIYISQHSHLTHHVQDRPGQPLDGLFDVLFLPYSKILSDNSIIWLPQCQSSIPESIKSLPKYNKTQQSMNHIHRADSRLAPSQWEMSLQSNVVSHWLDTNLEWALHTYSLGCTTYGLKLPTSQMK